MKPTHKHIWGIAVILLLSTSAANAQMGTAITYQGLVKDRGEPVTDTADLAFQLWDANGWLAIDMGRRLCR